MVEPLPPARVDAAEVHWGEDNPVERAPKLSEEEEHLLAAKMAAMDKLLADDGHAKWKIEVFFFHRRKLHALSAGALSIWESGTKFHGGGDTKAYFCPGKELGRSDCEGIIPDAANGYGYLVCPRCKMVWKGEQTFGEVIGNWSTSRWAERILHHYVRLHHNADIYLKYPRQDIRVAARAEQAKQLMGEKLERVRADRVEYIYPLRNIIKDTSQGADLLGRFHAFLTA